jgi:SAM-dependent methyltransferase
VTEWFERWFGEEYLNVYLHRDEEEAERLVALLAARGWIGKGERVLDLACGGGRHAEALRRRGVRVTGLDLSGLLLHSALRRGGCCYVRGDMRSLPFADGAFDVVLNLFTSFGYFVKDGEHQRVLRAVTRVLPRGGRFVLDYLNAPAVRTTLVPHDERAFGDAVVVQDRSISPDGRFVEKSIHLGDHGRTFTERVRLYERGELERMVREVGLRPVEALGDYDGGPHGPGSPRVILMAEKP